MDPTLKSFAVFINSNMSTNKTTEKSVCQIPFTGNFAAVDQTKVLQVALSQFKFTNSLYNINTRNSTLKIAVQFAPGRGYLNNRDDRKWETWTIRIPSGTYNIDQMVDVLSQPGNLYPEAIGSDVYLNRVGYESVSQLFQYAAVPQDVGGAANPSPEFPAANTFQDCFVGFGAIPADPTDNIITKGVVTVDNNSRVVFRSADLGHLIQYGTDITTPCTNILQNNAAPITNTSLDYSFVYKSVYLLFDEETAGLLKVLGFFNIDRIPAPLIPEYRSSTGQLLPETRGYGFELEAATVYKPFPVYDQNTGLVIPTAYNPQTMRVASDNITYYTFKSSTAYGSQKIVQVPTFVPPVAFSGYFPGDSVMFALYEANAANNGWTIDAVVPGMFISGAGVSVPSPYITNKIEIVDIPIKTPELSDPLALPPIVGMDAPYNTENCFYILANDFYLNNGYGLAVGSGITLTSGTQIPGAPPPYVPIAFVNQPRGLYIMQCDLAAVEVIPGSGIQGFRFRCNDIVGPYNPAAIPPINVFYDDGYYVSKSVTYTLNINQVVANVNGTPTAWVATLVSLNDRTARLVANLLTNLEGASEIHVHCAQLRTQFYSSVNFQPLQPSDVIAVIPIDTPFGGVQTYQPPLTLNAYLRNTNIVNLGIELTNSAGEPLDFNGLDWSMVLKCEEIDVMSNVEMNTNGTMNTVYQDEMANLESTAHSEVRIKRHRGKRMLPYQFFDSAERQGSSSQL